MMGDGGDAAGIWMQEASLAPLFSSDHGQSWWISGKSLRRW